MTLPSQLLTVLAHDEFLEQTEALKVSTGRKQRIGDAWLKEKRVKDNRSCTRTKKLS
ncbi:hypothetical protein [Acaryochloris marina]|uniref:hypothetical protein n=1 Tax=Acaryochloris marina TaxID=155978 RepID=UPI001BAFB948|nr:hypothetical protein [Acaryochloris marina]QUY41579.1 hypothetical protein I1H34_20380 [Acaryochloris marina S15]